MLAAAYFPRINGPIVSSAILSQATVLSRISSEIFPMLHMKLHCIDVNHPVVKRFRGLHPVLFFLL